MFENEMQRRNADAGYRWYSILFYFILILICISKDDREKALSLNTKKGLPSATSPALTDS